MSTFGKLSVLAQYDDMCRFMNKLVKDSAEEENKSIEMLENIEKRWTIKERQLREQNRSLQRELEEKVKGLQKELRKCKLQLSESRTALVRKTDENKTMKEQMRQVRLLLESNDGVEGPTSDAQRRRVIKCLDIERLSPIHSDDSDDCVSQIDYDRTEEDILDPAPTSVPHAAAAAANERSMRRSIGFEEAMLENAAAAAAAAASNTEGPTMLYRYYDKNAANQETNHEHQQHSSSRRSSRRSQQQQEAMAARQQLVDRLNAASADTDSNGGGAQEADDVDIEYVRQQLHKYEAEKKEKLASTNSTPNVRNQHKANTLSAKSAVDLMKAVSSISTPVPNSQKPHQFFGKKSFKPDCRCGPCGGKISFYGSVYKCEQCGVTCHPECKDKCPLPCLKITAPNTRSRSKKILISDYVNSDAVPKVPALIVHCCNEIEREDNITIEGLYRVVARTQDIEELQQKILKSKSGMPNLSNVNVHLLTGVVKRFLQSLDESLLTTTMWSYFVEAVRLDSHIEKRTSMSYHISYDLPGANRDTLAHIMQHLHAIAKHSDKNLMTTSSLAKTLAPTIVGNSCRNPDQRTIQSENKIQITIMETLFEIEEEFWEKFVHKTPAAQRSSANSLGSRLLGSTPSSSTKPRTRSSLRHGTLPTPKLKPLFS